MGLLIDYAVFALGALIIAAPFLLIWVLIRKYRNGKLKSNP